MAAYLLRRLINGLLVLYGVVSLVFLIFNLKPGDPARMLADQRSSPEALASIRKDLGLGLRRAVRQGRAFDGGGPQMQIDLAEGDGGVLIKEKKSLVLSA